MRSEELTSLDVIDAIDVIDVMEKLEMGKWKQKKSRGDGASGM